MGKFFLNNGHAVNLNLNDVQPLFGSGKSAIELNCQIEATEAMTFSGLTIANTTGFGTIRFRKNGVNGNQAVVLSGAGIVADVVNSDEVAEGDLFNVMLTANSGVVGSRRLWAVGEFASGDGALLGTFTADGGLYDVSSGVRYIGLNGPSSSDGQSTEVSAQWRNRGFTSWNAMQVRIISNSRTTETVFRNRINGVNGSISITIPAGETGLFVAKGFSDTLASGDLLSVSVTYGAGTEALMVGAVVHTLKTTISKKDLVRWGGVFGFTRNPSQLPIYENIHGNTGSAATDASVAAPLGFTGILSNLRVRLGTNALATSDVEVRVIKNGSPTDLALTLTAGVTGWYENTVDEVSVEEGDTLSYLWSGGSGTNQFQYTSVGMTVTTTVPTIDILNVDGDDTIVDEQSAIVINGLNFGPVTTVLLEDSSSTYVQAQTIDSSDATTITLLGNLVRGDVPFTSASHVIQFRASDGVDESDIHVVTFNPAAGFAVVEIQSDLGDSRSLAWILNGNALVPNESQIKGPTTTTGGAAVTYFADGHIEIGPGGTEPDSLVGVQFWDADTGTWSSSTTIDLLDELSASVEDRTFSINGSTSVTAIGQPIEARTFSISGSTSVTAISQPQEELSKPYAITTAVCITSGGSPGAGQQDITISGIGIPKWARVTIVPATTLGTIVEDSFWSQGIIGNVTGGGNFQSVIAGSNENNAAGSDPSTSNSNTHIARILNRGEVTVEAQATATFITDGIRLDWGGTVYPAAAYRMIVEFLYGDYITVHCEAITNLSTGANTITSPNFRPHFIDIMSTGLNINATSTAEWRAMHGVGVEDQSDNSIKQWNVSLREATNATTAMRLTTDNSKILSKLTVNEDWNIVLSSFSATGATLTASATTTNAIFVTYVNLGAAGAADCGIIQTPSSADTREIRTEYQTLGLPQVTIGFKPSGIMLKPQLLATLSSLMQGGDSVECWALAGYDGINTYTAAVTQLDNVATSNTGAVVSDALVAIDSGDNIDEEAILEFNSEGGILTFSVAASAGSWWPWLAIKSSNTPLDNSGLLRNIAQNNTEHDLEWRLNTGPSNMIEWGMKPGGGFYGVLAPGENADTIVLDIYKNGTIWDDGVGEQSPLVITIG